MAAALKPAAKRLVGEFQTKLHLSDVDSRRAAFVVLAFAAGWRKARIGRYLSVSRARIGQRVAKYEGYAESGEWPEIAKALADCKSPGKENGGTVTFSRAEWEDISFADDLLNRLV